MICCVCKKEVKRTYGDPRLNGVYCKSCAEAFERITPMDIEAYLMTNWKSIFEPSMKPVISEPSADLFHRLYGLEVIKLKDITVPWPKTNPSLK